MRYRNSRGVIHFFGLLVILIGSMLIWMLRDWQAQLNELRGDTAAELRALNTRVRALEMSINLLSARPEFQPQPPAQR